jgi:adenosylcobinamide kinase / adenosylcobinamide-phosphate guanylyltransferase
VGGRIGFVATARGLDRDMLLRIARHRAERPAGWTTIEEPLDVVGACRRLARQVDLVVADCLTVWVSNLMDLERGDDVILSRGEELAALAAERAVSLVLVSNEVGEGVHPSTAIGLRFRDLLGALNQRVAARADRVTLMVAGIPVEIKRAAPWPASPVDDRAPEAP